MREKIDRPCPDNASFNLRRAAEERAKADAASSTQERKGRLEMAAIFEARARALATLH